MAETQIRRKKRLPDQHCANPLFLKWLEEWRDEAQEKGLNSYHSYNKVKQLGKQNNSLYEEIQSYVLTVIPILH